MPSQHELALLGRFEVEQELALGTSAPTGRAGARARHVRVCVWEFAGSAPLPAKPAALAGELGESGRRKESL